MKTRSLLLFTLFGASRLIAAETKTPAAPTPAPAAATPLPAPVNKAAAPSAPAPASGSAAAAPATPAAPARGTAVERANPSVLAPTAQFEAFRLVSERNIFNPNRAPRRERAAEEVVPRNETISLVGTTNSDRGLLAFFDSSDAAHKKSLKVGESVGPFKVTRIAADGVDVEREGATLPVRVGQQLRKPEGGDWSVTGAVAGGTSGRTPEAAARPDPTAPTAIPDNVDDVTRRMMERRQKQLKN